MLYVSSFWPQYVSQNFPLDNNPYSDKTPMLPVLIEDCRKDYKSDSFTIKMFDLIQEFAPTELPFKNSFIGNYKTINLINDPTILKKKNFNELDYIEIKATDMTDNIVCSRDRHGRFIVAFLIKEVGEADHLEPKAVTFFQKYPQKNEWQAQGCYDLFTGGLGLFYGNRTPSNGRQLDIRKLFALQPVQSESNNKFFRVITPQEYREFYS